MGTGDIFKFSDEGALILVHPGGTELPTNLVPSDEERMAAEKFAGTTLARSLFRLLRENEIHDPLTSLLRREPGRQMIADRLNTISGYPFSGSISVLVLDLDRFKQVNDTYGHTVGDQVLSWFARILKARVRGSDIIVRWGGEEFVIFTSMGQPHFERGVVRDREPKTPTHYRTGATDQNLNAVVNNGEIVATRILDSMRTGPPTVGGKALNQLATIGVATLLVIPGMNLEGTFERLFEIADKLVITAKESDERGRPHSATMQNLS